MKYRKKPVVIEAFRYGFDEDPEWLNLNKHIEYKTVKESGNGWEHVDRFMMIQTLEGAMRADIGDYIIKGIKGEIYPCKSDIFELTYEAIE